LRIESLEISTPGFPRKRQRKEIMLAAREFVHESIRNFIPFRNGHKLGRMHTQQRCEDRQGGPSWLARGREIALRRVRILTLQDDVFGDFKSRPEWVLDRKILQLFTCLQ